MVAYGFKKRFIDPIESGAKTQTIRAPRKRHARVGEQLQLYTAMRTKHCRLLARSKCVDVSTVRLDFEADRIENLDTGMAWTTRDDLNAFAVRDGFADFEDMRAFWKAEHPDTPQFEGVLIRWAPNA